MKEKTREFAQQMMGSRRETRNFQTALYIVADRFIERADNRTSGVQEANIPK